MTGNSLSVSLRPLAVADLEDIWRHTAQSRNVDQADKYLDQIEQRLALLAENPSLGTDYSHVGPGPSAGLHDKPTARSLNDKGLKFRPIQTMIFDNATPVGHHQLKDQFCRIHGNRRSLHARTPSVGVARDSETPAWHTDAGKTAGGVHSIIAADV